MSKYGALTDLILALLAEEGPMCRAEICQRLNAPKESSSAIVSRLNKAGPRSKKRVYICDYIYDQEGERRYPRAVFALGDLPDKKRPKRQTAEVKRRSREKRKRLQTHNFVFNLGRNAAL